MEIQWTLQFEDQYPSTNNPPHLTVNSQDYGEMKNGMRLFGFGGRQYYQTTRHNEAGTYTGEAIYYDADGASETTARVTVTLEGVVSEIPIATARNTTGPAIEFTLIGVQALQNQISLKLSTQTGFNKTIAGSEMQPSGTDDLISLLTQSEGDLKEGDSVSFTVWLNDQSGVTNSIDFHVGSEEIRQEYADVLWVPMEHILDRQKFIFAFIYPNPEQGTTPDDILKREELYGIIAIKREDEVDNDAVTIDLSVESSIPTGQDFTSVDLRINDHNPRYMYQREGTIDGDLGETHRSEWMFVAEMNNFRAKIIGDGSGPDNFPVRPPQADEPTASCFLGGNYFYDPVKFKIGDCFRFELRAIAPAANATTIGYSRVFNIKAGMLGLYPPIANENMALVTYSGKVEGNQLIAGTVDNYFHRATEDLETGQRDNHGGYRTDITSKVSSNALTKSELVNWLKGKFIFDNEYRTVIQQQEGAAQVDFMTPGPNPNPALEGLDQVSCQTCHVSHDLTLPATQSKAPVLLSMWKLGINKSGTPALEPDADYSNIHADYSTQKNSYVRFNEGFDELTVDEATGSTIRRRSFDVLNDADQVIFSSDDADGTNEAKAINEVPLVVHTPRLIGIAYQEALPLSFIQDNAERASTRTGIAIEELTQMVVVPTDQDPEEVESRYFSGINGVAGNLEQGIALALGLEFDRSSSYYPDSSSSQGDVPDEWINLLADYLKGIPAISRDELLATDENTLRGEVDFSKIGCSDCHDPNRYPTQNSSSIENPRLPGMLLDTEVRVFTDMLFWDLGFSELLPEVPDDTPLRTRTRSLVDIGWSATTQDCGNYISVLGACTLEEAILAHGGEAEYARSNYLALTDNEKNNLVAFLESL
ncbi:MAG: di-heme oxidoredictase family protein [Gammaproteobacteria bacterium]